MVSVEYFRPMKIFAFLLFVLCGSSLQLRAQAYEPLVNELNEWHFTTCFSGCNTSVYFTDGDTIVGGDTYKILDGYHYISRTFLLREDVPNKQVYLAKVNPVKTDITLLYDFSKQEGDTMTLFNPNSPFMEEPGVFQLDSIRLKPLVNGNYRHFYWSPANGNTMSTDHPVWVEGVGSLSLINAAGGEPDFNGVGELSCFFKNNNSFYANLDSISSCEPTHFLSLSESALNEVVVFPNPFINQVSVTLEQDEVIQVFTPNLMLVLEQECKSGLNNLKTDFLASGVYFLKTSGSTAVKRMIKL